MAESLLVSNSDILFMILSLLPVEVLLRVKSVCRAWARVISDPAFTRAHCSRPTPITAFFTIRYRLPETQIQGFKPIQIQEGVKFPSSITSILSSGFKAVSGSHGLLCFRRDWVFIVGNPATSHWCVLHSANSNSLFMYHGAVVIYDPTVSIHFKLAVALIKLDNRDAFKHYIKFNIYSSETSSWTVSSLYTQCWNPGVVSFHKGIRGTDAYEPCKIGGGSICWFDGSRVLVGYEISTGTYWKVSRPSPSSNFRSEFMSCYNSTIYFGRISEDVTKVWRLEGKNSWVLEGEGDNEELRRFVPTPSAYDPSRGALIIGGRRNGEYFALNFSSSTLEILSHGVDHPPIWEVYDHPRLPHGNTLAPLHGAEAGMNGLTREFHRMGLRPLDL
ncbi:hypothetical protein LUZ63_005589 [Rhynchospora breviuscula]|uniref:F-box domain-containing protein n=1 Tax=Rhynchospora breviuscula TaxID=2022672 RepID=A0A9Q0HSP7_9POAL|nr:hypothetical protein LUZ63_005589 [Rhynchospora breviuscula]